MLYEDKNVGVYRCGNRAGNIPSTVGQEEVVALILALSRVSIHRQRKKMTKAYSARAAAVVPR